MSAETVPSLSKNNNVKRTLTAVILIVMTALSFVSLTACTGNTEGFVFGTYYSYDYKGIISGKESESAEKIAYDIEHALSTSVEESTIFRLNASPAGKEIALGGYAEEIYLLSLKMYEATSGAFDPATFPLTELWKFSPDTFIGAAESIPDKDAIANTLAVCDFGFFEYDAERHTLRKSVDGAKLDFGAIAKGFAVDRVYDAYVGCGCDNVVVDIGGTIRTSDEIELYVADPRGSGYAARINRGNFAVSTSGDYQRYYVIDGVRYHHIMGKDGYPTGLGDPSMPISVTVVGESAAVCDALSTAIMVLGYDNSLAIVEDLGYSALILTENGYYTLGEEVFEILTERQKLN